MVWRDEVAPEEVPLGAFGAEWRSGWTADVDEAASTAADGWAEGNDVGVGVFFDSQILRFSKQRKLFLPITFFVSVGC